VGVWGSFLVDSVVLDDTKGFNFCERLEDLLIDLAGLDFWDFFAGLGLEFFGGGSWFLPRLVSSSFLAVREAFFGVDLSFFEPF